MLSEKKKEIIDRLTCICHSAYKNRGLIDSGCIRCAIEEELGDWLDEYLEAYKEELKKELKSWGATDHVVQLIDSVK